MRRLSRRAVLTLATSAVVACLVTTGATAFAEQAPPASMQQPLQRCPDANNCVFRLERGRFTAVDIPFDQRQDLVRFNNRGDIVGGYVPPDPPNDAVDFRGYLLDRSGRVTLIDFPGALATIAQDINDRGQIVGKYSPTLTGQTRGFLRDRDGRYRTIHPRGAVASQVLGINNHGHLVGEFTDRAGGFHGFLWRDGRFTTLDRPDSAGTTATDINDHGRITGSIIDQDGSVDGFLLAGGRYRSFQAPDGQFVALPSLNNRGQIAGTALTVVDGQLVDASGFVLRDGVHGAFTQFDVPGADSSGGYGITDSGVVTGLYVSAPDPASLRGWRSGPRPGRALVGTRS